MKSKHILLAGLIGMMTAPAFGESVVLTLTGSTAFRSVVTNRVFNLFQSNATFYAKDSSTFVYSGTMPSVFPSATNKTIKIHMSFSGSATGMQAVQNQTLMTVIDPNTGASGYTTNTSAADVALSDVFPSSATPPISDNAFAQRDIVGVVPFVFVKNNTGSTLAGVTGITRDQAYLLMSASGLMPASFLGGSSANPVLLCGRDSGSGTRITTERCIGFFSIPTMATNNGIGGLTNGTASGPSVGYNSGGTLAKQIATNDAVIGYLGLSDYSTITNNSAAAALAYDGVPYTSTNVLTGKYAIWGYEHVCSKSGLSADQQTVRNAIVNAIKDATFQHTDSSYVGKFEAVSDMQVERNADGGPILSLSF